MTFITQYPLNKNVKEEKLSFSINGGMSNYNCGVRGETESQLSVFLPTTYSQLTLPWKKIQQFIQEGFNELPSQAKLVMSNHHSNTYLMDRLQWWKYAPNRMQIPSVVILLMVTLSPACAKEWFGSLRLSWINVWIAPWILEEKWEDDSSPSLNVHHPC
jgi:hypothetical protein